MPYKDLEKKRAWCNANKDKIAFYSKKWRENNKERWNKYIAEWRTNNSEFLKIRRKEDYEKNKERQKNRPKQKYYRKVSNHNRRIREKGLTTALVQRVYEDNIKQYKTLKCIYCLKPTKFGDDTLEHKTPLIRGGTNEYTNLGIACKFCNFSKHHKTEQEYRESLCT